MNHLIPATPAPTLCGAPKVESLSAYLDRLEKEQITACQLLNDFDVQLDRFRGVYPETSPGSAAPPPEPTVIGRARRLVEDAESNNQRLSRLVRELAERL